MPDEAVVADSGPLIALALGRCLHLLRDLYGKVLVPEAVWREVTEAGHGRTGAAEMAAASWLERRTPVDGPSNPRSGAHLVSAADGD
jgi:hypothetical protein